MTVRGVIVLALVMVAALIVGVPSNVNGATYVVDDDGGSWANYTSIGDALGDAVGGDTILVFNGTYAETFTIGVSLTMIGNGTADTFVNGSGLDDVITVTQNDVNISGLAITHDGTSDGIYIDNVRSIQGRGDGIEGFGVDTRIRVDEAEDLSSAYAGAAVANCGDQTLLHRHNDTAPGGGKLTRTIGRGVVRHDHLDGVAAAQKPFSCDIHRVQQAGQQPYFVVGWDDQ